MMKAGYVQCANSGGFCVALGSSMSFNSLVQGGGWFGEDAFFGNEPSLGEVSLQCITHTIHFNKSVQLGRLNN